MADALPDLARVLRSKNAGPFQLTLDVLFRDRAAYDRARASGVLDAGAVAALYGVAPGDVVACVWMEQALGWKLTLPRAVPAGGPGDADAFGTQAHAPLLGLMIP